MGVPSCPTWSGCPPMRVGWEGSLLGRDRVVAHARHRVESWVREQWRMPEAAFQAETVAGELCANALRHGGGLASLDLILCEETAYCPPSMRILVGDYLPQAHPRLASDANPELDEHGRGLLMVTALTAGWGWHRIGADLKQVWCKIVLPLDALPWLTRS